MKKTVNEAWLTGLNPKEREEMKNFIVANEKVLDKLKEILYNIVVKKEEVKLDDYNNPSWSHKQAHLNGEQALARKMLEVLTIKERDDQPIN